MNDPKKVESMYIKKDTLSIRQNIHDKYSVNKYGWHNWVLEQYNLKKNINIIEFGCGTGSTWIGKEKQIPENVNIILTDISPLMVERTKGNIDKKYGFSFKVMDIQDIPFENEYFDIVIANHMLYHVSDIKKSLSEVKRILKKDGIFYATTIGKNHLKDLEDIYRIYEGIIKFSYSSQFSFTLQNGEFLLKDFFGEISQKIYEDYLEVTAVDDIMDYITSYNHLPKEIYQEIYEIINKGIKNNGKFKIKKESGIFVCNI